MSPRSKREYLESIFVRYKRSSVDDKSKILDEFCSTCHYHRKHAIRLLNRFQRFTRPKPKRSGKPSVYSTPALRKVLTNIWLAAHMPCSKRLKVIIPQWLPYYGETFGGVDLKVILALKKISPATIDRLLKTARHKHKKIALSTTRPGSLLRHQIPIKTNQWEESEPGFLETDLVAHCGESAAGQYVSTVDCVDIATAWSEQRAVWGKGETDTLEQIKDIEDCLPFALKGFDCDNDGAFLNWHLVRHFQERQQPIQFTRSRAYKKDDNAHVEQKNYTHVRQWIGYDRFENQKVKELLNDLYKNEWRLFHNFFSPSMKLVDKRRIRSKIIKIHDAPKTPYRRVLEHSSVPAHEKAKLTKLYRQLNPFELRFTIDKKIAKILTFASKTKPKLYPSLGNIYL